MDSKGEERKPGDSTEVTVSPGKRFGLGPLRPGCLFTASLWIPSIITQLGLAGLWADPSPPFYLFPKHARTPPRYIPLLTVETGWVYPKAQETWGREETQLPRADFWSDQRQLAPHQPLSSHCLSLLSSQAPSLASPFINLLCLKVCFSNQVLISHKAGINHFSFVCFECATTSVGKHFLASNYYPRQWLKTTHSITNSIIFFFFALCIIWHFFV